MRVRVEARVRVKGEGEEPAESCARTRRHVLHLDRPVCGHVAALHRLECLRNYRQLHRPLTHRRGHAGRLGDRRLRRRPPFASLLPETILARGSCSGRGRGLLPTCAKLGLQVSLALPPAEPLALEIIEHTLRLR